MGFGSCQVEGSHMQKPSNPCKHGQQKLNRDDDDDDDDDDDEYRLQIPAILVTQAVTIYKLAFHWHYT